ncbi:hypothetical protein MTP09_09780 [Chryseobacterium suipulveris]|uniref:AraC family transcriptional regulator n=1 Tax=Chryseobacterium suipulveris TaxID=2929800 RepID=A0ABY4BLY5_9FLAO|nr:hypothetical protein [Chryseobacterium suipulveris]UOE40203.1 hypothetical protein MTP09_09780 [Chryseobacterium suipulveris]
MKYVLELILATIIIFFLWNILKRMFFTAFYKFPKQQNDGNVTAQKTKKNLDSKLNWDAETVDYEEVKEEDLSKK